MIAHIDGARGATILASTCRRLPLATAMAFCFSVAVPAATITVGSGNLTAGVGNCTLLEAVKSINEALIPSGSGCIKYGNFGLGDTITLKNFAFSLSNQAAGGAIAGDSAIVLTKPVTLIGDVDSKGKPLATIQRNSSATAFRLIKTSSSLTLIGVKLQNGVANAGDGGALNVSGHNSVQLSNSTISGNSASAAGGGVYSTAALTISDSTISGNTAGTGTVVAS